MHMYEFKSWYIHPSIRSQIDNKHCTQYAPSISVLFFQAPYQLYYLQSRDRCTHDIDVAIYVAIDIWDKCKDACSAIHMHQLIDPSTHVIIQTYHHLVPYPNNKSINQSLFPILSPITTNEKFSGSFGFAWVRNSSLQLLSCSKDFSLVMSCTRIHASAPR